MSAVKILGLAGSTREGSYNRQLLNYALQKLEGIGATTETFDLKTHPMPLFDQDQERESGLPDNARALREAILAADGVLLACPEYNASITPLLKNALDWSTRTDAKTGQGNVLDRKVIALISASAGPLGGIRGLYAVRQTLLNSNALILGEQAGVAKIHEAFNDEGNLIDERTAGFLQGVLDRLVFVSGRLRP
ncbi:MAG: NADPH-dependent FMN reductase [Fimbriimonas sp.]